MVEKLKKIWKNKFKIIEGVWNSWFPSAYVKNVAGRRLKICKTNLCGFYEPVGASESCVVKGKGCCGGCGCNITYKTSSLSSYCYLKDMNIDPLWDVEMTESEEKAFYLRTGLKHES